MNPEQSQSDFTEGFGVGVGYFPELLPSFGALTALVSSPEAVPGVA